MLYYAMEKEFSWKTTERAKILPKVCSRKARTGILFLAALLTGFWLPSRFTVSISPSLDHRIFFLVPFDIAETKDGDYLVFDRKPSAFVRPGTHNDNHLYIKQVGCCPGEHLSRDRSNRFFCQTQLLGKALSQDSKGKQLPQFNFNGVVPENSFFMVGSHPRSFDSRYYGFIHAKEIKHKAIPLW